MKRTSKRKRKRETSTTETGKVNSARAVLYDFLSRAFKVAIDDNFLETIVAVQPTIKSLSESRSDKELEEGSRELLEFAGRVKILENEQRRKLISDLTVEYAKIFLEAGSKQVRLLESAYRGIEHRPYEKPFHDLLEAYRSLGFEKAKDFPESEDHVSVEFDFMARLCGWTSQSLKNQDVQNAIAYLSLQKEFLRDHILRWVPEVCRRLDEASATGFYNALGHLTLGFITIDNEMPDHIIEMLRESLI